MGFIAFFFCTILSLSLLILEPREKTGFLHICENKDTDQLRSNCAADQRLCFCYKDTRIVHILWMYSPVYVGPGRKPQRPVFSQRGSINLHVQYLLLKHKPDV